MVLDEGEEGAGGSDAVVANERDDLTGGYEEGDGVYETEKAQENEAREIPGAGRGGGRRSGIWLLRGHMGIFGSEFMCKFMFTYTLARWLGGMGRARLKAEWLNG